ncbi:hypothetical protein [Pararhizobium antarcticum]|uniref:hypothetical protein n=1 Tax=Pararhizobium antarcticum TaxID=1798805 RepID=UPI00111478CF|nr:hypothetical protein [Pararhizobium antarcticum]
MADLDRPKAIAAPGFWRRRHLPDRRALMPEPNLVEACRVVAAVSELAEDSRFAVSLRLRRGFDRQ